MTEIDVTALVEKHAGDDGTSGHDWNWLCAVQVGCAVLAACQPTSNPDAGREDQSVQDSQRATFDRHDF